MTAVGLSRVRGRSRALHAVPDHVDRQLGRRALNVAAACVGLLVGVPVMLLIGLAVRVTSPGPALYKQTRVGLDRRWRDAAGGNGRRQQDVGGKPFTIYKFRTMYVNGSDEVWACPDDPRVTPLGRFLRKYRLDELPQLLNVLRSDMNLVGPRPEQLKIFARLREEIGDYPLRQRVPPGITGWAQVNASYDSSTDDVRRKLRYDLEYVTRCSVLEDLKIMARTVPVVVFKRGAW